ncbi:hypothetical protein [Burkholderia pyrrocinia]
MYLTLMHPDMLSDVVTLGRGLWIVGQPDDPILVIKTGKEVILTAKESRQFKMYLAPCEVGGRMGLTVVSAFFDDPVSPLVIVTPLVASDCLSERLRILCDRFKVCFFDEHNREWLSCAASADLGGFRGKISTSNLLDERYFLEMLDQAEAWFSESKIEDDANAFTVFLTEELFPSDFVVTDMTQHKYLGSPGFTMTHLERPEPGAHQEVDIIYLLQRCYPPERIIHGPLKDSDGEELVDVLVLGEEVNLLLQAKDSPNTANSLAMTLERKRRKARGKISEGLSQLRGAISTIRREKRLSLKLLDGGSITCSLMDKPIVGIVIVRELFQDSYADYGSAILDFMDKYKIPALVFDYPQFEVMTRHCPSESMLLAACYQVFECARDRRIYPRLNFSDRPPY